MNNIDLNSLPFVCIGHRGACGYAPENTLSSFQLAMDMGCPWVELDVYAVEGELLVIHDDTLERTSDGKGRVMDATLAYLRSLDAGKGQQIPTLSEVIELIDHRAGINVELKGPDTAVPASQLLSQYCQNGWSADEFLFSSFFHDELAKADSRFHRGPLFHKASSDLFEIADSLDAFSINLNQKIAGRDLITRAHEKDLSVYVYTVNKTGDIARMIDLGVDGVFTNYPDRVFTLLSQDALHQENREQ